MTLRAGMLSLAAVTCGLLASIAAQAQEPALRNGPLLEVGPGIASEHPGDRGLADDQRVIFVEDFEEPNLDALFERWENVQHPEIMTFSEDVPSGSQGQCLLMTHIGGQGDGGTLYRRLLPGYERLFYRFYVKFDPDCFPIHHFFHVGGYNPATPWPQGGAGVRPDGNERFTTGVEPFGDAWRWDYYSYWMEMNGSPPRGQCWGNSFIHDPQFAAKRGEWMCLELMMQVNDVGESNGEMALWVNGRQASHIGPGFPRGKWSFDKFLPGEGGPGQHWDDATGERVSLDFPAEGAPFEGFRWRNDEDLKLNFLWLLNYITDAPQGHVSKVWFDQIVVAREYIGPIHPLGDE